MGKQTQADAQERVRDGTRTGKSITATGLWTAEMVVSGVSSHSR